MNRLSRRTFIKLCSGTAASLGLLGPAAAAARLRGQERPPDGSFLRFDEITLFDHRGFRGYHAFGFGAARTEIIGPNGSGKSTIAESLASCGSTENQASNVHVRVSPAGCERLLHRYRDLVHVSDEFTLVTRMLERLSAKRTTATLEAKAVEYFRRFDRKADSVLKRHDLFEVLRGGCMGQGDRIAAGYSFLLAERDLLNYRLPLVLDDPFGPMDYEMRHAFSTLIAPLETQVILLTSEDQLRSTGWPSWHALNGVSDLKVDRLPGIFPNLNEMELRRALHLSGSSNRYLLS